MSDLDPQISVVLCSAGAGTHLSSQLAALSAQETTLPWELVVVDNGCTPSARRVVHAWLPTLPSARIIEAQSMRGPAHGRNAGVAAARAPLVAFCDDDDVVSTQWVQAMRSALLEHDLVGGSLHVEKLNSPAVQRWRTRPQGEALYAFPGHLSFVMSCNMGVRRDMFLRVEGFDPALYPGEDVDLSWKIQQAGGRMKFEPDAIVHYRYRSTLRGHLRQQWFYGRSSALIKLGFPLPGRRGHARTMAAALVELLSRPWVVLRSREDRVKLLGGGAFWLGEAVTLVRRRDHRRHR